MGYLTVLHERLGVKIGDWHAKDFNAFRKRLIVVCKSAAKIKLSEPPAYRYLFYKNAFIATKNKSYFIKLVDRSIK